MRHCPDCGVENEEESRFCSSCGRPMAASDDAQERKLVSALFCDLADSTALGERLDPEEVAEILESYYQICRRRIETHGGTVEKYIGDAVVAVFGVPQLHEDDAERAVRAGLRIVADLAESELSVQARVGVSTGEVLVRGHPDGARGYATGDVMNTASRIQSAASPMEVLVGELTRDLTKTAIRYEAETAIDVKGKSKPVEVWRAIAPLSRVSTPQEDATPFVGRGLEISLLQELWRRVQDHRASHFVTILGDAGIGKSRLVREFARILDSEPMLITWRVGHCPPYGEFTAYAPLVEIIQSHLGVSDSDESAVVEERLDVVLQAAPADTQAWLRHRIGPLLGLAGKGTEPQSGEFEDALLKFLQLLLAKQPAVVVIEDLHWATPELVGFLSVMSERLVDYPAMVICTARPDAEELGRGWPPARRATTLSLAPLQTNEIATAMREIVGDGPEELVKHVAERCAGSPLFAEQLILMWRDQELSSEISDAPTPTAVQSMLAARIDTLDPFAKKVLKTGAVVGATISRLALQTLLDEANDDEVQTALQRLVRKEFLREEQGSATRDHFTFWHALVRDVAYGALTRSERARLHLRYALWAHDHINNPLQRAEGVVHHVTMAQENGAPPDDELLKELQYALLEALRAMGEARLRTAPSEAIVLLERQQGLVSDPVDLGNLALTLARAHMICSSASRSIPYYAEAFQILERNGSSLDLLHCLDEYSWALIYAGEADKAIELVDETASLVDLGEVEARATYLWAKADLAHYMEDLTHGESYLREALGLLHEAGREVPARISALDLVYRAAKEEDVVESDAVNVVQQLVQDGETGEAMALMFNVALNIGDPEQKLRWWDRREDLAGELGQSYEILQTRLGRLVTQRQTGQFEEASGVAEELLESARQNEDPFVERMALHSQLFIDWCLESNASDETVSRFIELSRAQEAWVPLCVDLLIHEEAPKAAEELLREIWERISDEDKWRFSPRCAQLGRVDLLNELEGRADAPFRPINVAYRTMAEAYLARSADEHQKAADLFTSAAVMFADRKLRPEHAIALAEQATCEVAAHAPSSAETVQRAVDALNAIGCVSRARKLETTVAGQLS